MGTNSWYRLFPSSPPLDAEAGLRFEKRKERMENPLFKGACILAGIEATPRQARKFNQRKGLATRYFEEAKKQM